MDHRGRSFEFSPEESRVLNVGVVVPDPGLSPESWLVGKLLSRKPFKFNFHAFKSVLLQLWNVKDGIEIREFDKNLFTFRFSSKTSRDTVLRSGPWFFQKHTLVLNVLDLNIIPSQIPLVRVPVWVQVFDLPLSFRSEEVACSLGRSVFDGYIDCDRSEANRLAGSYFRIRVWVNVTVPLKRGLMMCSVGGIPFKVFFKYEKLFHFCYGCGLLDHAAQDCEVKEVADGSLEEEDALPFGSWLCAAGGTGGRGGGGSRGDGDRRRRRHRGASKDDGSSDGSSSSGQIVNDGVDLQSFMGREHGTWANKLIHRS